MRGVSECIKESELNDLLNTKKAPKAYIGYEPSGVLHAGSLVPMLKVRDLIEYHRNTEKQIANHLAQREKEWRAKGWIK